MKYHFCQENSEFWAQIAACFLNWNRFWCENGHFLTFLEVVDYQAVPISLHLFNARKICFWVVRAML